MNNVIPFKREKYFHFLPPDIITPDLPITTLLIGAGGTGSALISGLARINYSLCALGHPGLMLHVFDGDVVSEANIGRQLFALSDVGLNKAVVQVTRVNNFFGFNWKSYPVMFTKSSLDKVEERIPLVITAVDDAEGRILIGNIIRDKATYWIDTGNTSDTGQVVYGTLSPVEQPKKKKLNTVEMLPTVVDLYPELKEESHRRYQGPSCSVHEALMRQDLFINQQIATSALKLLWKAFRKGKLTISGYFINFEGTASERALPIDPDIWKSMGWEYRRPEKRIKTAKSTA